LIRICFDDVHDDVTSLGVPFRLLKVDLFIELVLKVIADSMRFSTEVEQQHLLELEIAFRIQVDLVVLDVRHVNSQNDVCFALCPLNVGVHRSKWVIPLYVTWQPYVKFLELLLNKLNRK